MRCIRPVVPLILCSLVIILALPSSPHAQSRQLPPSHPSSKVPVSPGQVATPPSNANGPRNQSPSIAAQPIQPVPAVPRSVASVPATAAGLVQMQFDNIELRDLIRFVSNIMGRNFIYDEAVVRGRATVLSPRSLTKDEVFRVFESVLNYYEFTIMATLEAYKIVRAADAKGMAVETLGREKFMELSPEERITTLVVPLDYLDSNTMAGILRPLLSRDAYLVSVPSANSLIMIDAASNLQRLKTLIGQVDLPVSRQLSGIEVYNVQHTNAVDLAKALRALLAEGKEAALSALKSGLNIGVIGQSITFQGVTFPNVQAFIQALAANHQANILSTPQLLTLNNEEAEVLIGSNIPYTTSVRVDTAGNPITNFDYRDVGVKLKVKPYINKDGLVYLNIFTEITTVQSTVAQVGSGV